jgi:hypothetical protein
MPIFQDLGRATAPAGGDESFVFNAYDGIAALPARTSATYQARIDALQDGEVAYDAARATLQGKGSQKRKVLFDQLAAADIAFTEALQNWNVQERLDALQVQGGNLVDVAAKKYFDEFAVAPIAALTTFLKLKENGDVLDSDNSNAAIRLSALGNADGTGVLNQDIEDARTSLSSTAQTYFDESVTEERDSLAAAVAFYVLQENGGVLDANHQDAAARLTALGNADGVGPLDKAIQDAYALLNPNARLYLDWSVGNLRGKIAAEVAFLALGEAHSVLDPNKPALERLTALGGGIGAQIDNAIRIARGTLVDVGAQRYFDTLVAEEIDSLVAPAAEEAFETLTNGGVLDVAHHDAAARLAELVDPTALFVGVLPGGGAVANARDTLLGNDKAKDHFDALVAEAIATATQEIAEAEQVIAEALAQTAFDALTTNGGVLDVSPAEQFRALGGIQGVPFNPAIGAAFRGPLAVNQKAQDQLNTLLQQRIEGVAEAGAEAAFAELTTGGVLDVSPADQFRVLGGIDGVLRDGAIDTALATLRHAKAQGRFNDLVDEAMKNTAEPAAEAVFHAALDPDVVKQFEALLVDEFGQLPKGSIRDAKDTLRHQDAQDHFDALVQRKVDSIAHQVAETLFAKIEVNIAKARDLDKFAALIANDGPVAKAQDFLGAYHAAANHLNKLVKQKLDTMAAQVAADAISFFKNEAPFNGMLLAEKLVAIDAAEGQGALVQIRGFLSQHNDTRVQFERLLVQEALAIRAQLVPAKPAPAIVAKPAAPVAVVKPAVAQAPAPVAIAKPTPAAVAVPTPVIFMATFQKYEEKTVVRTISNNGQQKVVTNQSRQESRQQVVVSMLPTEQQKAVEKPTVTPAPAPVSLKSVVVVTEAAKQAIVALDLERKPVIEQLESIRQAFAPTQALSNNRDEQSRQTALREKQAETVATVIVSVGKVEQKLESTAAVAAIRSIPVKEQQAAIAKITDPKDQSLAQRLVAINQASSAMNVLAPAAANDLNKAKAVVISDTAKAVVAGKPAEAQAAKQQMTSNERGKVQAQAAKVLGLWKKK